MADRPQTPHPTSRPPDNRPPTKPTDKPKADESPAEAGRRLAREHAKTYKLSAEQIVGAARILAAVARENHEARAAA